MESPLTSAVETWPATVCHVVAVPFPGRGHVNPMLCFCDHLLSKKPDILTITFVVTEEWLGLISATNHSGNIRFATVPNVIPSELERSKDFPGFVEAVWTKLEAPFERLLDGLKEPPAVIVADTFMRWVVAVGNRRNIPVASLWTQSMSMYALIYHFELLERNGHFPINLSERGDELLDYIPGISPTRIADLPSFFTGVLHRAIECISTASKAQFFLSTSFSELEPLAIVEALRPIMSGPIYFVGPTIPFSKLMINGAADDYLRWLDSQPSGSVLYVSLGSFLSVSNAQMEEIIAGVRDSGARFLWVARGDTNTSLIRDAAAIGDDGDHRGLVVPWCDQLKVLCHDSVGGFWTHSGWNSTLEAIFSGVPMLTFPIFWDQIHNSKQIVDDWKIGFRVKKKPGCGEQQLVTREEIAELVKKLMDPNPKCEEAREVRRRVEGLKQCCVKAIERGSGSSDKNLDAFIGDILHQPITKQPGREDAETID